jgi:hypothetical protein
LRAGRVDRKIELGYATCDQARRLFLWFFQECGLSHSELAREADRFAAQVPPGKIAMAAIQEHLLRHRRSPGSASHEVVFDEIGSETQAVLTESTSCDSGSTPQVDLVAEPV